MNKRRSDRHHERGMNLGRLFFWTALLGVVFGAGLIVGQRILLEESLPPIISVGEAASKPTATTQFHAPEQAGDSPEAIFSFYETLTNPEIHEISPANPPAPSKEIANKVVPTPSEEEPSPSSSPEPAANPAEPIEEPSALTEAPAAQEESPDESTAPGQAAETDGQARFTLQVGSHPTLERARTEMDRLRTRGLDPHVVATELAGQGTFYRVRIGKFPSMELARVHQEEIHADRGIQTFVTPL